eukprot:12693101-Prorocentrum_lima.AAC.1
MQRDYMVGIGHFLRVGRRGTCRNVCRNNYRVARLQVQEIALVWFSQAHRYRSPVTKGQFAHRELPDNDTLVRQP